MNSQKCLLNRSQFKLHNQTILYIYQDLYFFTLGQFTFYFLYWIYSLSIIRKASFLLEKKITASHLVLYNMLSLQETMTSHKRVEHLFCHLTEMQHKEVEPLTETLTDCTITFYMCENVKKHFVSIISRY